MYVLILILSLSGTIFCQTINVWNGITPLKSTRADVEKILGKPVALSVARHAAGYKTKDGRVFVLYSTGLCDVNPEHGWNIPELTVVKISYYPDRLPKLSDLQIDLSKFTKSLDPGSLNGVSYTNKTEGIMLTVDSVGDVIESFGYFPESKYDHLKCKNTQDGKGNNVWNGITPLKSTRADVEKILGKPNECGRYELPEGRVYVSYFAATPCPPELRTCRCLAPIGTVSELSVTFNDEILLSSLRLDPKKWLETPTDGHLVGEYTYFNKESGITYGVLDGIVRDIVYHESAATCAYLMKKKKP